MWFDRVKGPQLVSVAGEESAQVVPGRDVSFIRPPFGQVLRQLQNMESAFQ